MSVWEIIEMNWRDPHFESLRYELSEVFNKKFLSKIQEVSE